jgi:hypothetical protein
MKIIEVRVPHITSPKVHVHQTKKAFHEALISELELTDYPTRGKSIKKLMTRVDDFHAYYFLTLKQARKMISQESLPFHNHKRHETFCALRRALEE